MQNGQKAGLNDRQKAFAQEYLIDLNATQAAIRAGYSEQSARQHAHRMMTNDDIQIAIQDGMKRRSERTGIDADRVLNEYARIGFSDIRKIFDENGQLHAIHDMPDTIAPAIRKMNVTSRPGENEGDEPVYSTEIELWDKMNALGKLAEHVGLFKNSNKSQWEEFAAMVMSQASRPLPLSDPRTPVMLTPSDSPLPRTVEPGIGDADHDEVEP